MKETLKNARIAAFLISLVCYLFVLVLSANQSTTQTDKDSKTITHVIKK